MFHHIYIVIINKIKYITNNNKYMLCKPNVIKTQMKKKTMVMVVATENKTLIITEQRCICTHLRENRQTNSRIRGKPEWGTCVNFPLTTDRRPKKCCELKQSQQNRGLYFYSCCKDFI